MKKVGVYGQKSHVWEVRTASGEGRRGEEIGAY